MGFGKHVRQAREAQNFSQDALAIAAGVSRRTIQNVEAGRAPSAETARALMAVLGMEPVKGFDLPASDDKGVLVSRLFAALICAISLGGIVFVLFHSGLLVLDNGIRVDGSKLSFQLLVGIGSMVLIGGLYAASMLMWGKMFETWNTRRIVFSPAAK